MKAVIIYRWMDTAEKEGVSDLACSEHDPERRTMQVSLKDPTEGVAENHFMFFKAKIYLVPQQLLIVNGEIHYEMEKCELEWCAKRNTVVAKNLYGTFELLPSD